MADTQERFAHEPALTAIRNPSRHDINRHESAIHLLLIFFHLLLIFFARMSSSLSRRCQEIPRYAGISDESTRKVAWAEEEGDNRHTVEGSGDE